MLTGNIPIMWNKRQSIENVHFKKVKYEILNYKANVIKTKYFFCKFEKSLFIQVNLIEYKYIRS